jgi:hypothetical protein
MAMDLTIAKKIGHSPNHFGDQCGQLNILGHYTSWLKQFNYDDQKLMIVFFEHRPKFLG